MPLPRVAILDAPTNLGLQPPAPGREPGVRRLPEALRAHGIVERLNAEDAGRVPAPDYAPGVDPTTGVRNGPAVAIYARDLAETAGNLLDRDHFPLILGGDCSLLLGPMLALRRRGRFGLLFLDGHQDLLTPETSQSKGAAGMDLALACGIGPASLTTFDGLYPLVRPEDVIMLGDRSGDTSYPSSDVGGARAAMYRADVAELRRVGVGARTAEALARLRSAGVAGVWVHLDADVLDNALMPAVDSPQPDGLSYAELHEVLSTVLSSGLAVGMEVTILDPDLDPHGRIAGVFVDAFVAAFGGAAQPEAQLAHAVK